MVAFTCFRSSHHSLFDCLQHAKTEEEGLNILSFIIILFGGQGGESRHYHLFGARMQIWYTLYHLGTLPTHLALFKNLPGFSPTHYSVVCKQSNGQWEWSENEAVMMYSSSISCFIIILSHLSLHDWSTADTRYTDRLVSRSHETRLALHVQIEIM